jgi:hypothetical protein
MNRALRLQTYRLTLLLASDSDASVQARRQVLLIDNPGKIGQGDPQRPCSCPSAAIRPNSGVALCGSHVEAALVADKAAGPRFEQDADTFIDQLDQLIMIEAR